jgi:hypothetical protein
MSKQYDPLKTSDHKKKLPEKKKKVTADMKEAWTTHYDNGKPYYYNSVTNLSTWELPDVLAQAEVRTGSTEWKEYRTQDGRKYYHNSELNITQWDMPPEYRDLLESKEGNLTMIKKLENMDFRSILSIKTQSPKKKNVLLLECY